LTTQPHDTAQAVASAAAGAPVPAVSESSVAIARNAFHLVLGQIVTTALAIALNATLGRALGAVDFGVLYLVTTMATFSYVFVDWGQNTYLVREVARHPARAGELLGTSIALRVCAAALVCALAAALAWLLGYDARTRGLAAVLIAAMLPFVIAQTVGQIFRGRERMDYDALVGVLAKTLTLIATLAALALGGRLLAAILAQGMGGMGALGLAWLLLRRLKLPPLRATLALARELLVGGTPFVAMVVGIHAQVYLDAIVLSKLASASSVGWYGAARTIISTIIAPASIVGTAAFPRLSRAVSEPTEFKREVRTALRPLLGLGTLAAVGTYLFADLAVRLIYGHGAFAPAATLLRVFAPLLLLFFVDVILGSAVMAARPKQLAAVKLVAVALTTGLDVLLVPVCQARYGNGGIGLVLAFAGSEALMVVAAVALLPRGTLDRGVLLDVGRALLAGAGTLLVLGALPSLPPFVSIPACVALFSGLALMLGLLGRPDLLMLTALLGRRAGPALQNTALRQ
jgi:O-antigen/teichoic acid export membrane protein